MSNQSYRASLAAAIALAVLWPGSGAKTEEAAELSPFIGETVEEFEARRQGIAPAPPAPQAITVPADERGHFIVHPRLGGRQIPMLVDTGASVTALSHEDAERVGLRVSRDDFTRRVATANGVVEAAPVRLGEVQLGEIRVRDVEAVVLPPGRLGVSLLGMSFLRRLRSFEVTQGRLALFPD